MDWSKNHLFYGDNLEVLRRDIPSESVDLVYLDPPFNSNRSYNVLFKHKTGAEAQAQIEAFDDTWTWSQEAEQEYLAMIAGQVPSKVSDALVAMRGLLGENDVLAYLVMMTSRLVELHRVLKPTGSLYLHCDPTASHYLKVMLDTIFGAENFRSEIAWHYSGWNKRLAAHFERRHDIILFYAKGKKQSFNSYALPWASQEEYLKVRKQKLHVDDDGRAYVLSDRGGGKRIKRYIEEAMAYGRPVDDVWDIDKLNNSSSEALGYPTQKPLALLERIIAASSNPGDVVLDPFCGCGTTIDAAQRLGRRWIGIDITYLAVDLIDKRLLHSYGDEIMSTYDLYGIPRDIGGAHALFDRNPFDFERWAVSQVGGQPNDKQVGDKGIDGVMRFSTDNKGATERILISVKGGKSLNPAMVRDLIGTVDGHRAAMGVLVTMEEPTRGMVEAAQHSGLYTLHANGQAFPKVQIITVKQLLNGERPKTPPTLTPYTQAQRHGVSDDQMSLL